MKIYWVLCKVLSVGLGKTKCSGAPPLDVQKFSHHGPVQPHATSSAFLANISSIQLLRGDTQVEH